MFEENKDANEAEKHFYKLLDQGTSIRWAKEADQARAKYLNGFLKGHKYSASKFKLISGIQDYKKREKEYLKGADIIMQQINTLILRICNDVRGIGFHPDEYGEALGLYLGFVEQFIANNKHPGIINLTKDTILKWNGILAEVFMAFKIKVNSKFMEQQLTRISRRYFLSLEKQQLIIRMASQFV